MILVFVKWLVGLLPAAAYLAALIALDSYKLVRLRAVILAMLAGVVALVVCNYLNAYLIDLLTMDFRPFSRYVAPVTEEAVKAVYVVWLVRRGRIGFMVDAVILGFAVGTGFGILENVFYLNLLPEAPLYTWILRGFGTALMHGSTTGIFSLVCHYRLRYGESGLPVSVLSGFAVAVLVHSLYNHFLLSPPLTVLGLTLAVPVVALGVYRRSERSLAGWLGRGFDMDVEMLSAINEGRLSETRVGGYLLSIRDHFTPEVVADMFCLLRLQVELAIQAKGALMLRRTGFEVEPDPELEEKLEELSFLERSIGPTGRLALKPLRRADARTDWERHLLGQ